MADEQQIPESENKTDERDLSAHDPVLRMLVKWCKFGFVLPVTLFVGGKTISGELATTDQYFQAMGGQLNEALARSGASEQLVNQVGAVFEELAAASALKPDDNLDTIPDPYFIVLKRAYFWEDGRRIPTGQGIWWRGKISAVDGFLLGNLHEG